MYAGDSMRHGLIRGYVRRMSQTVWVVILEIQPYKLSVRLYVDSRIEFGWLVMFFLG